MLNTILEVDKLLQKSTEGVNYLNNGFDLFIRAPVLRGEYLDRCNDTYKCLERLVDDELIESFESEIRAAYLSYHDLSRMLSFLNIIDGRVSELTDSLWKFYDNKIHELENIEWLTEDDIATLDEVRGIAKYATVGRDVTVDIASLLYGDSHRFVPLLWQPRCRSAQRA